MYQILDICTNSNITIDIPKETYTYLQPCLQQPSPLRNHSTLRTLIVTNSEHRPATKDGKTPQNKNK